MARRAGLDLLVASCLALCICLAATQRANAALDAQELVALQNLTLLFPDVLHIPEAAFKMHQPNIGGVWKPITDDLCDSSDGWVMHGVKCQNGHIQALHMYVAHTNVAPLASLSFCTQLLLTFIALGHTGGPQSDQQEKQKVLAQIIYESKFSILSASNFHLKLAFFIIYISLLNTISPVQSPNFSYFKQALTDSK